MHELDDPPPRVALRLVPEPGAAGRDAALRRHAGHLGVDEPGAAERATPVMHQVPVVGQTVLCHVLRHRRDDDPVRKRQSAQAQRQEHRRPRRRIRVRALRQPSLVVRDELAVAELQVVVADALATGQQAVGELARRQDRVALHVLEPLHAVARGALELQHLDAALLVVRLERSRQDPGCGHVPRERDRVLHGELRAGADREVRRVRRIADQHHSTVMPAAACHAIEVEPGGAAPVARVALQPLAAEVSCEQALAELDRLRGVALVQAVRPPGFLAGFDDHGRQVGAELVRVDLEPAVLGLLEGKGEGVERAGNAQPDVSTSAHFYRRVEDRSVPCAHAAVGAVGPDHQVGVRELAIVVDLSLEFELDAELRRALLQDSEQLLAAYAAETVTATAQYLAAEVDLDVVPVVETPDDGGVRCRVGHAEVVHRLVGEDDAPAEGIVGPITLVDLHSRAGQRLPEQDGRIQPRRPAAEAHHPLHRADAIHREMDTPFYLTCQLNRYANARAPARAVTRHSVSTSMRTLLTLESTRATVNLGIGFLALTRTSSPSSTSTVYSADNALLKASRMSWATWFSDRPSLIGTSTFCVSPPTGVTAKRIVPLEFALSLTSIRQRCDAFGSAAIAAVPARIAAAIAAAAQPRCLLLIMSFSLCLKLLMFRRATAAGVPRRSEVLPPAFACAAVADNLSLALRGGAAAAADTVERTALLGVNLWKRRSRPWNSRGARERSMPTARPSSTVIYD